MHAPAIKLNRKQSLITQMTYHTHCRPRTQRSTNTVPTLEVCHGCGLDCTLSDQEAHMHFICPYSSTSTNEQSVF